MNEQTNNTDSKTLLKVKNYMTRLIWIFSGAMTGRFLHVYFDYKSHPAMYSAPYRTLSDILKSELTWYDYSYLYHCYICTEDNDQKKK